MRLKNCEWMMSREDVGGTSKKKKRFPQSLMMKFNLQILFIFLGLEVFSSFSQE